MEEAHGTVQDRAHDSTRSLFCRVSPALSSPSARRDKAGLGGQLVFQAVPSSTPPTAEVMPDPRDGTRVRVRSPSTLDPALAVGATARQAPRDAPRAAAPTGEQARTLAARRAQHLMGGVFLDVREHGAGGRGKARDDPFLGMEVLGELRVDELTGEVAQDWDMSGALVSGASWVGDMPM